jgi:hypothetical protein
VWLSLMHKSVAVVEADSLLKRNTKAWSRARTYVRGPRVLKPWTPYCNYDAFKAWNVPDLPSRQVRLA